MSKIGIAFGLYALLVLWAIAGKSCSDNKKRENPIDKYKVVSLGVCKSTVVSTCMLADCSTVSIEEIQNRVCRWNSETE